MRSREEIEQETSYGAYGVLDNGCHDEKLVELAVARALASNQALIVELLLDIRALLAPQQAVAAVVDVGNTESGEFLPKFLRVGNEDFSLAETCVTQAQYRTFCALTEQEFPRQPIRGMTRPVVNVTLLDANAYCAWLGRSNRATVRLPTEEEWLKATSPDGRKYAWGNEEPDPVRCDFWREGRTGPDPVDAHPTGAGAYGHLGLSGGVWEWMAPISLRRPERVYRGGSWNDGAWYARAASRFVDSPDGARGVIGFRPLRADSCGS